MKHKRAYYRQRERHNRRMATQGILAREKMLWIAIAAQVALHVVLLAVISRTFVTAPTSGMADAPYLQLYLLGAAFDLGVTILLYFVWPLLMIPVALMIPLLLIQPIILISALLSSDLS